MGNHKFSPQYEDYRTETDRFLESLFLGEPLYSDLYASIRYSLLAGGKRIRPALTLEFADLCGMDWHKALPVACAVELVHTYSLIHDDLPCMDNDELRRGKLTNHKMFGETLAVLAGDALQPEAFRLILSAEDLSAENRADCALILARAAGADGMVAGQVLDTLHHLTSREDITLLHSLKTGAMISAAAEMGCAAAGAGAWMRQAARQYASQVGLAFQIRDDMLDVIGSEKAFGKPIGSDKKEGKLTFVDLLGMEGCGEAIRACTEQAKAAVEPIPNHAFLFRLADYLADRTQ
ncbi:polyprenyl synthetase family protein [Oscillibacter hominis]|uniref:Farnesyl diphosphate synthase n=1 Tax=Oscillibacter hominis TaxID=2763056 RepID=A0A7G9B7K8_9FIRM|nr:farnesyl diphosphate synthase [Oscillibacter hominis]QNL45539.1 polyprenyl synthetase family protein [Oscillibacter hominis]